MIVAIVLAAGQSTRMGRPKQTLLLHGKPMLEDVLDALRQTKVDRIVVVLGANEKEVKEQVKFQREEVVFNPRYAEGMSRSLKAGLAAAGEEADAAIVVLGDQPLLSPATVNKMVDAYLDSRAPVVVPVYHGIRGNPVLFGKTLFPRIMTIHGDSGAKAILEENKDSMLEVEVEDEGIVVDIDTPADYEEVARSGRSL